MTAVGTMGALYLRLSSTNPTLKALSRYRSLNPFQVPLLGPIGMLPLPTKYTIRYGEPFHFYREYGPDTVRSPDTIRMLVGKVRGQIEEMLSEGLRNRKGVFGFSSFLSGDRTTRR